MRPESNTIHYKENLGDSVVWIRRINNDMGSCKKRVCIQIDKKTRVNVGMHLDNMTLQKQISQWRKNRHRWLDSKEAHLRC